MHIIIPIIIAVVVVAFLCMIYRVADIDKALIITGGKEPVIKVSGGAFVIPIFRKAQYFDLCMITVKADRDEIRTSTSVPIVTDWTAQIRPDTTDLSNLKKAIVSFKERGQDGIIQDVKLTLTGAVRDIVASMTPEAVLKDKAEFAQKVKETVEDEMRNMGMELVSLNIQDITDNNHYYDNIAALDMEEKRLSAEKKKAEIEKEIRNKKAETEQEAAQKELASKLAIAEKARDNAVKEAEFKVETDTAQANAAVAGTLQLKKREQEVAEQEGKIQIVKEQQSNLAAAENAKVIATKEEAEANRKRIEAEGLARAEKIAAENRAKVAIDEANAIKAKAEATAEKILKEGNAEADVEKAKGLAVADVEKAKGLAEAEVVKAKLMAQAEGEKALADALASNEKVNFEIEKLKIESQARIEIATKTAQIMANIGQNAEFVNIGGGNFAQTGFNPTGNVLLDTLSGIPMLMKTLDVQNQALNDKPFNEELHNLVDAAVSPAKGLLVNNTEATNEK